MDGFLPLHKTKSHDSVSSNGSRRRGSSVSGPGWLRKLSQKISNSESASPTPQHRRSSVGSSVSNASQDYDASEPPLSPEAPTRTNMFKDSFVKRSTSVSGPHSAADSRHGGVPPSSAPAAGSSNNSLPNSTTSSDSKLADPLARTPPATLEDLKKRRISVKSVGFALSTFASDPPQRIPPLKPASGNIEFSETGEDIRRRMRSNSNPDPATWRNHSEVTRVAQLKARQNAERLRTTMNSSGGGLSSFFHSSSKASSHVDPILTEEEEPENSRLVGADVDGTAHAPKFSHRESTPVSTEDWENHDLSKVLPAATPDQVYTRCCHLREIMPIRNILRQLQGQLAPLPRVRVANTKPTLVEIQAFSDFLTVVPISSLVLDNHILTDEMLRLILAGVVRSRDIVRITFVNTRLSPLGWQYLCSFLAASRKSLLALNFACTNPTALPQRVPAFDRRDMNWRLLSEALTTMGSLEELDLGGTKIPFEDLKHLVENGFKRGRILGLANNDLSHEHVKFIADWAKLPDSQLMGINLSGNDLSQEADWGLVQSFLKNTRIFQLSLRNSKLSHEHASRLLKSISTEQSRESNLRHLDLSENPDLFPYIVDRLVVALPSFPYLSRLQLEKCNLSNDDIVSLCEAFSYCHRLVYLSVAGNGLLTESAATALCVAVRLSRSICTVEADINEANVGLRQQLARYCIQNLESNAGSVSAQPQPDADADAEADMASFQSELKFLNTVIKSSSNEPMSAESTREVVERIEELRKRIMMRMHSLLIKRKNGPLPLNDRETTMRLFFYSTTLDRLTRDVKGIKQTKNVAGDVANVQEEAVENVGEEDLAPSLNRVSSQASIMSLKKLEREEGESHKAYQRQQLVNLDDDSMLNAVGKLKIGDLDQFLS